MKANNRDHGAREMRLDTALTLKQAQARGYTRGELLGPRFVRPFRGMRALASAYPPESLKETSSADRNAQIIQLAHLYEPLLGRGGLFSHSTALVLHGCPIRCDRALHVTVPVPRRAPTRVGITGHRHRGQPAAMIVFGLPVVAPAMALAQAGQSLGIRELVVAIDHLVRPQTLTGPPIISHEQLGRELNDVSQKGVGRAREAWRQSRVGAESRMETLLRIELERHGVHHLELQVNIHDAQGFIGRFDLVDRKTRTVYEYDGEQHRTKRAQYLKDVDRLDRVRDAGWRVIRFHHEDLFEQTAGTEGDGARVREKLMRNELATLCP